MKKLKEFSPLLLRIAMALIFVYFGTSQFTNTNDWLAFVPQFAVDWTGMSATALVHLNGTVEIVLGTFLLFGFVTRWIALLLALHLLDITLVLGFSALAVRDLGLTIATFCIFLNGDDWFTLDYWIKKEVSKFESSVN